MSAQQVGPSGTRLWRSHLNLLPYLFLAPGFLLVSTMVFYPAARALVMSLGYHNLLRPEATKAFVGMRNYVTVITSRDFWVSLRITAIYTFGCVAAAYVLGMYAALLLNNTFKGRAVARTILLVPWAILPVATSLNWLYMFDYQLGILNHFLAKLGLRPVQWLLNPNLALMSVLMVSVWRIFPYAMVTLLGALQTIPGEIYDAAIVDGAGGWQTFRYVTLPSLRPVSTVLVVLLTVWTFMNFVVIYVMTEGGPGGATTTLPIKTYLEAFKFYNFSRAATYGVICMILSITFSIFALRWGAEGR